MRAHTHTRTHTYTYTHTGETERKVGEITRKTMMKLPAVLAATGAPTALLQAEENGGHTLKQAGRQAGV